jgi:hypothetical protein
VTPKGMTRNSKWPWCIRNTVLATSSGCMRNVVTATGFNLGEEAGALQFIASSSTSGMGKLSLMV